MNAVVRWIGVLGVVAGLATGARADDAVISAASTYYPVIEVWKTQRRMELRRGSALVRRFQIVLGQEPREGKQIQGDGRTPVGRYYISDKHVSRFHRFLGISYPNVEDAERGYTRGLIDAGQWADIFFANVRREPPTWRTMLGGRVGIHGYGAFPYVPVDWTEGCIAVSNDDVDFLYDYTPVGTPVIINE